MNTVNGYLARRTESLHMPDKHSRKRSGGDNFEPMHITPDETKRLQREWPQILYDLERNERDDVSSAFPEVLRQLSAALDEHLAC